MTAWTERDYYSIAEWAYGCYQQGDLPRARILFAALLELRPSDSYAARGLAGVSLQEGNAEEAIQLMNTVLRKRPTDLSAKLRLVEALIAAGRLSEAELGLQSLHGHAEESTLVRLRLRLHSASNSGETFPPAGR